MVGGDNEPDDEGTADVKQAKPDVHALNRLLEIFSWVFHLPGGDLFRKMGKKKSFITGANGIDAGATHCNHLRTYERESSLCHDDPPAQKSALRPCDPVKLNKWSRISPVTKPNAVMIWPPSEVKRNAKNLSVEPF